MRAINCTGKIRSVYSHFFT